MNVTANITGLGTGVRSYTFKAIKHNKQSTIFELIQGDVSNSFITQEVKLERFQRYSNATGIDYYLRLKNEPTWSNSELVTGLFKTTRKGIFYGDRRENWNVRTLIIFKVSPDFQSLTLIVYPRGQFPKNQVENIAHKI
jgi:hypothetical protein